MSQDEQKTENDPMDSIRSILGTISDERVMQWHKELVDNPCKFLQEILCQLAVAMMLDPQEAIAMSDRLAERMEQSRKILGHMSAQERLMIIFLDLGMVCTKLQIHMDQKKQQKQRLQKQKEHNLWN